MAATALASLVDGGHQVVAVVTRPDRRRGRGGGIDPSPVKEVATTHRLPVFHRAAEVVGSGAEIGVVVAYGSIIKPEVLAALPMVNLHFSLLPRWRGAAPVERAILAGDAETGVCLMEVVPELDAGGVYMREKLPIGPDESAAELRERLGEIGNRLLGAALSDLPGSLGAPKPQAGEPTWADKISLSELRLDWSRPAAQLARVVRVGRAWAVFRDQRLVVWRARVVAGDSVGQPGLLDGVRVGTGDGALELIEVQPAGKRRMAASDWARGVHAGTGECLA